MRQSTQAVDEAMKATRGEVLVSGGEICDARFSKCCGGQTEEYQYCWENQPKAYLTSVSDPFCNTRDAKVIRQVLNDYDQATADFYEWTVEYSQEELSALVAERLKMESVARADASAACASWAATARSPWARSSRYAAR